MILFVFCFCLSFLESWLSEKLFMDFACDKTRAIVILEKICQEAEINEVKWFPLPSPPPYFCGKE